MEKKTLKKLKLVKERVSSLTPNDQSMIVGGGTTSFNYDIGTCGKTNFTCCGPGSWSMPKSCCASNCGCPTDPTVPIETIQYTVCF